MPTIQGFLVVLLEHSLEQMGAKLKRAVPVTALATVLVLSGCGGGPFPQNSASATPSDTANSKETTCTQLFSGGKDSRFIKATAFLKDFSTNITPDELMEAKTISQDLDSVAHGANDELKHQVQELRKPFTALLSANSGSHTIEIDGFKAAGNKILELCPEQVAESNAEIAARPPSKTPTTTLTPTPAPAGSPKSVRGNLVVQAGDVLELQHNGVRTVAITVKGITPNAECYSSLFNPDQGQSVVLDMEIITTPELGQALYPTFTTIVDWKAVTADGITVNGRLDNINCIAPAQRVPSEIGPSERIVGKMAFDVPPGAGTLIWRPSGATSGWEWAYPSQ
ncbi:hypothetical protein AB0N24_18505 [Arthrobacter sp. NPDC093128]|uniref:hypothetical protein n=1 Tax=Arthrobacter sp. NPDC093128 TaxID=3154979 RepID=UPI0034458C90